MQEGKRAESLVYGEKNLTEDTKELTDASATDEVSKWPSVLSLKEAVLHELHYTQPNICQQTTQLSQIHFTVRLENKIAVQHVTN